MTEWKPLELFFKVTGVQGISYPVSLTFLPERKKQRNPPGLEQSLGRGFWSRIPAPFPRQFCTSRTSVISIPSNVFFPNTATLAKSRFPSSDQIPYPVKKVCVFPNPAQYFGQIPDSESTLAIKRHCLDELHIFHLVAICTSSITALFAHLPPSPPFFFQNFFYYSGPKRNKDKRKTILMPLGGGRGDVWVKVCRRNFLSIIQFWKKGPTSQNRRTEP